MNTAGNAGKAGKAQTRRAIKVDGTLTPGTRREIELAARAIQQAEHIKLLNLQLREAEAALAAAREEIDLAWKMIENAYHIETRADLEEQAKTNGFKYGLHQAVFHIWKRDPKVAAAVADALGRGFLNGRTVGEEEMRVEAAKICHRNCSWTSEKEILAFVIPVSPEVE
jgi:hypothetical protein